MTNFIYREHWQGEPWLDTYRVIHAMPTVGKTFLSDMLEAKGFAVLDTDDLVLERDKSNRELRHSEAYIRQKGAQVKEAMEANPELLVLTNIWGPWFFDALPDVEEDKVVSFIRPPWDSYEHAMVRGGWDISLQQLTEWFIEYRISSKHKTVTLDAGEYLSGVLDAVKR